MASTVDEILLCFAYIHDCITIINNIHDIDLVFPDEIIFIIFHYFEKYFEWDPTNCASEIELSNNNTIAKNTVNRNRLIISKNIISANTYDKVEWEVKITRPQHICIAFGCIESPVSKSIQDVNETTFLSKQHQHSVYIHQYDDDDGYFDIYDGNNVIYQVKNKKPGDVKNGDTLKLIFDFKGGKCNFSCNNELLAVLMENMDDETEWIPAIACCRPHQFETVLWKCHHKFLKHHSEVGDIAPNSCRKHI